jgi:hypothetical protein
MLNRLIASLFALALAGVCCGALTAEAPAPTPPPQATPMPKPTDVATPVY